MIHIVVVISLASGASWLGTLKDKPFATVDACKAYIQSADFDEDLKTLVHNIVPQGPMTFSAMVKCDEGNPA